MCGGHLEGMGEITVGFPSALIRIDNEWETTRELVKL